MTNRLKELKNLGQSIWYDNIRRAMLTSGEFAELIEYGILGVTSNPTIFEKAIAGSSDYDDSIKVFIDQGVDLDTIYERLVLEDIATAANMLRPVFERSGGIPLLKHPAVDQDLRPYGLQIVPRARDLSRSPKESQLLQMLLPSEV